MTLCGVRASQRGLARFGWGGEDALCEAAADALDADEPKDEPERERTAVAPAVEEAHRGLQCECEEYEGLDDGWERQERCGERG